jgi:alpha-amylase
MNWEQFRHQDTVAILQHWKKLGKFRKNHPSVAFGTHRKIQDAPYVFSRVKADDRVVIGLDLPKGEKSVIVSEVFKSGEMLRDAYSGTIAIVEQGKIRINSPYDIVLLEAVK